VAIDLLHDGLIEKLLGVKISVPTATRHYVLFNRLKKSVSENDEAKSEKQKAKSEKRKAKSKKQKAKN
jgi:hypothetical protein